MPESGRRALRHALGQRRKPARRTGRRRRRRGGSTYNFAAPIGNRVIAAFRRGDLDAARAEQYRVVQLVDLLSRFGFMVAAKATMGFLGVPVGPARLPHANLTADQAKPLRAGLESLGFFDWVA